MKNNLPDIFEGLIVFNELTGEWVVTGLFVTLDALTGVPHTWVNCIDANEAGDPQAQVHQVQLNDFLKTFFPNRVKF